MPAITATFRADLTQFESALAKAQTTVTGFERSTSQVNRELTKFGNEFSGANLQRQALSMARAVEDLGGATKLTAAEQRKLADSVDAALDKYRALGQAVPPELIKVSAELGKIKTAQEAVEQSAKALGLAQQRSAQAAAEAHAKFAANLQQVGSGLTRFGGVLTATVSAPIVAGFALSIKAAKDFESAFANVVKTVEGLDVDSFGRLNAEAQALRGEIRNLAKEIPVAVEELANIAAIGGQFGVSRDALVGFTDTVAKLGVAVDGISAEEAAAAIAQIGAVAKLSASDFNRFASSIVALGNAGTATEGAILEMSKRFASAGTAAGLSAAKIAGVAAAVSNLGIEAEKGGSALSKTFNEIGAAVAKGGKDLDAFAKVAGVSSKVFAETFTRDAVKGFDLFLGGLNQAVTAGGNFTIILEELGITEARQADTIRSLALAHKDFAKTVDLSSQAFKDNTALNEEARKKFATFDNQLLLFKNQVKDVGIELGGPLLESLRSVLTAADPLLKGIAGLAKGFSGLKSDTQTLIVSLLAFGATTGPLVLIAGGAIKATTEVIAFTQAVRGLQVASAAASATTALGVATTGAGTAAAAALPALGTVGLIGALLGINAAAIKAATGIETKFAVALAGLGGFGGPVATNIQQLRTLATILGGIGDIDAPTPRQPPDVKLPGVKLPTQAEIAARLRESAASPVGDVAGEFASQLTAARAALEKLTAAEREEIKAAKELGASSKDIAASLNAQREGLGLTAKAIDLYTDGVKKASKETNEFQKLFEQIAGESAGGKIRELEVAFNRLTPAQRSNQTVVKALLEQYEKLRNEVGDKVSPALEKFRTAVQKPLPARNLAKELGITALPQDLSRATEQFKNQLDGFRRDGLLPVSKEFKTIITDAEGVSRSFYAIGEAVDATGVQGERIHELLNTVTEVKSEQVGWLEAIQGTSDAFSNLAQIGGSGLEGFARQLGEIVTLMGIAGQAGTQLRNLFSKETVDALGNRSRSFSLDQFRLGRGNTTNAIGAYAGAAQAAIQGGFSLSEATNVQGRGNRALRGAAAGASIGGSIVPGYGHLVGAAVGALVGALRNPAFEDVFKRVAKNFGLAISDETAKAIAKISKDQFKGDRAAAEIFSLDTIIGEGGGLDKANIDKLTARLRDAFSMKELGKFNADQLETVLKKNFGAFAAFVEQSTSIAGKGFVEILQLAKQFKVELPELQAFVGGQAGRVGGSLEALAGPLLQQLETLRGAQSQLPGLQGERDALRGQTTPLSAEQAKNLAAIEEQIRKTQSAIDDNGTALQNAQSEFDRLGVIGVGAFNAARAAGLGFLESTDALTPGLDRLVTLQRELGLQGNAAFTELLKFRDLVGTNETLVASAEGLNEAILGLSNVGGLTTETLAALKDQGLQTFDRLTAAGFTSGQSIEILRGFLDNLAEAHIQLGIPIDENTQKLLDQAAALEGLGPKTPTEAMTQGFKDVVSAVDRLTVALGGEVPAAAAIAGASIAGAASTAAASLVGTTAATDTLVTSATGLAGAYANSWVIIKDGALASKDVFRDLAATSKGAFGDMASESSNKLKVIEQRIKDLGGATDEASVEMREALETQWEEARRDAEFSTGEISRRIKDMARTAGTDIGKIDDEFDKIYDTLTKKIPDGADIAGRAIRDKIPRSIPININFDYEEFDPERARPHGDEERAALGAVVYPRPGGTLVRVGEANQPEVITPLNRLPTLLGPQRSMDLPPIIVNVNGTINGETFTRFVARALPRYVNEHMGGAT